MLWWKLTWSVLPLAPTGILHSHITSTLSLVLPLSLSFLYLLSYCIAYFIVINYPGGTLLHSMYSVSNYHVLVVYVVCQPSGFWVLPSRLLKSTSVLKHVYDYVAKHFRCGDGHWYAVKPVSLQTSYASSCRLKTTSIDPLCAHNPATCRHVWRWRRGQIVTSGSETHDP